MTREPSATILAGLVAVFSCLLLLPSCQAKPEDAAAQVPGVQNGDIQGDASVIVRRVFEGSELDFYASEPSPDGRYVTEIDWVTGDLAVVDLLTGEQRRITDKAGGWAESASFAWTSTFSPAGDRIAYVWYNCLETPCWPGRAEIRVIDADGSNERTLFHAPDTTGVQDFYLTLHGWVDDSLLARVEKPLEQSDARTELVLVSATNGSVRSIVEFRSDAANRPLGDQIGFSPDGRFMAYGIRSGTGEDQDIMIVATADGQEAGRIAGPANDRVFGFSADGAGLLFGSDRELTEGIWNQPLRDGRPNGDPVLLRSDLWRTIPIGLSRAALFFGIVTQAPGVRTATFDPETGTLLSEPTPVEPPSRSGSSSPIWSPDGLHLAYRGGQPNSIVIRSLAGDDVREIPVHEPMGNLRAWTEEGTILTVNPSGGGPEWVKEVDLATGTVEQIFEAQLQGEIRRRGRAVSQHGPSGPQLFYTQGTEASWTLVARDIATGAEREVLPHESWGELRGLWASPDGRTLVLELAGQGLYQGLVTVSSSGGEVRQVPGGGDRGVVWAPDNRHFFFLSPAGDPPSVTLWKGDAETGEAVRMSEPGAAFLWRDPALHPDGRRIAFRGGEAHAEVWMMTNLPDSRR